MVTACTKKQTEGKRERISRIFPHFAALFRRKMDPDVDFTDRLRDVFDLCDSEGRGYISVDYLIDLAKEHFGSGDWNSSQEAINEFVSILDSDGSGQINFEQFCKGVRHIQGPLTPRINGEDEGGGEGVFEYSNSQPEAKFETFEHTTKSQSANGDVKGDDGSYAMNSYYLPSYAAEVHTCLHSGSSEDDVDSGFSNKSNDHFDHNDRWSESTEKEATQLCYEADDAADDVGTFSCDHSKLASDSDSNCLTPFSFSSHPGSARRLTSSAIASQLYRGNSPINVSRRSSVSDGMLEEMDGSFIEMNDKIRRLEDQIKELSTTQERNDEKHSRMKEENSALVEKVHLLEEQLREIEQRSQEQLNIEQKKHHEVLVKTDKDKSREIEILSQSLLHIEREYAQLQEEMPTLRSENDRLRKENCMLEKEVSQLNRQFSDLSDEHQAIQEHIHTEQIKMSQEHKVHTQLISELSKELEELRIFKADAHTRSSPSLNRELPRSLRKELDSQINRLKLENRNLREETEDLRAQLISRHVQEGRSLLQQTETSVAAEFEKLPRDELMKALQKEKDDNKKLREYVDLITLRILEKNPSILEVSGKKK